MSARKCYKRTWIISHESIIIPVQIQYQLWLRIIAADTYQVVYVYFPIGCQHDIRLTSISDDKDFVICNIYGFLLHIRARKCASKYSDQPTISYYLFHWNTPHENPL